ncbi:MAG: hypothetical protein ACOYXN_04895 [Acidobacteriota bacterium]
MRKAMLVSGAALLSSAWLLATACALLPTRIGDIVREPGRFENHTVTVRGEVLSATKLPFMDQGFYVLRDATGEITVVTRGALPAEGQKKRVTGKVQSTFKVMGKSLGVVLQEGG